ncbi:MULTISPECIES: type VI secretion system amidase effector protein Tae4 [unclassified Delftia]|uniref:type VI secretion system amidase effector protein Tae4 n=1 Tax=unclassified Delftia TaxID=2613839 RepID=UPI0006478279|nr:MULTISPECIES: type VI secretion system amidase effector protein Tae4 [unclassified Delftia]MDC2860106.1 type VI secretion system amidase effector protein Tae4 [Delftia sp. DT-2]
MATKRPAFSQAWHAFMAVRIPVKEVGRKIGGMVQKNTELDPKLGGFENACPIRMSYVLNMTGFPIPKGSTYKTVSGADGRQYMYRVAEMMAYLEKTFGKAEKTVRSPKTTDFIGMKGIIVVKGHGWGNAIGHVTLWNGTECSDTCHLMSDPDNGTFVPDIASIWVLP